MKKFEFPEIDIYLVRTQAIMDVDIGTSFGEDDERDED